MGTAVTLDTHIISLVFGILESLITAGITGLIVFFFTKKYFSKVFVASKLKSYGFDAIETRLSDKELKNVFQKANAIKIMYVSGDKFLDIVEPYFYIAFNRKNPPSIKYLLSKENTSFLQDIQYMETSHGNRLPYKSINENVKEAIKILKPWHKQGLVDYRQFNTQYRLPVLIAEYHKKDYTLTKAWLTITLPPYKSKESMILKGKQIIHKEDYYKNNTDNNLNLIDMMQTYFDTIWEQALTNSNK